MEFLVTSASKRVIDDRNALENILLPLGYPIPQSLRLMSLGRLGKNGIPPLKVFCGSKEVSLKQLTVFSKHKGSGSSLSPDFRISRTKTPL